MILTKSNLADMHGAKAVGFTIKDGQFFWLAESNLTAEKILSNFETGEDREEQDDATAFLREALRDGPRAAEDLKSEANKLGISEKRLRTARIRLKVKVTREGYGQGSKSYWSLPDILAQPILAHEKPILALDAHVESMGKYGKYDE